MPSTIAVHIFNESPVVLWGLNSRERLKRILSGLGVDRFVDDLSHLPDEAEVLILRGDYLFDNRIIAQLLKSPDTLVQVEQGQSKIPVAAHCRRDVAEKLVAAGSQKEQETAFADRLRVVTPRELTSDYMLKLRKFDTPYILPISEAYRDLLEKHLFACSYKGVTDLVTKWLWPGPARRAVKFCVKHNLKPNQVTLIGFFLAILAGLFFYHGWYGPGLAAGWLMTFLDTVDGKLARVTVTSSRFGHLFDHAIDIIHPPLWYLAWAAGLAGYGLPLSAGAWTAMLWLILTGYLGGRVVEAIFTQFLGRFGIFCWQPRDSWFRLVTGRRNPCMILLTLGYVFGRPDLGLWAVAVWTFVSTLYLGWRLFQALQARKKGPLKAWFENIDPDNPDPELALSVRIFTRRPTRLPDGSTG